MRVNVNRIANLIICSIDEIHISYRNVSNDIIAVFNLQFATTTNDNDLIEIHVKDVT